MKMSEWRELRNRQSLARLENALPAIFPAGVLTHARARRFIPPLPRLAIDGYWRAHPVRADRLARALAFRSGTPDKWRWQLKHDQGGELTVSHRTPPAPYREAAFALGPGHCCVCGQAVYRFGWHVDLWGAGANRNAGWHSACVVAWRFWTAPSDHVRLLKRLQGRRCAATGGRLWKTAEVDHRVPLFRVWHEMREMPWPALLGFWGLPNLQVINRDVHAAKCADEAGHRARNRTPYESAIAPIDRGVRG